MASKMEYNDPQAAFNKALVEGRLVLRRGFDRPTGKPTVSDYMYMGTCDGKDLFKHNTTREYLP